MPIYQYRCDPCGSFDLHRAMAEVTSSAPCPNCLVASRRVYEPFASRSRAALAAASGTDRARVDRARSGQPAVTSTPTGRRFRPSSHRH